MSGTFQGKLITPRSIQVQPNVLKRAAFYAKSQGLDKIIEDSTERVRNAKQTRNTRFMRVAGAQGYDYSSLYWAFGISVALFFFVTVIRNR